MKIFNSFTAEVVQLLKDGAVGIVPTDTVYGIVTPLFNEQAVERIYTIKGRPPDQPVGTILIGSVDQIDDYTDAEDLLRAQVYWPGPTSVILNVGEKLRYAHRGFASLPFRIPGSQQLQHVLLQTGPIATTSANHPGKSPATVLEETLGMFRESVDFYVDGGNLSHRKASKIIQIQSDGSVKTIR